jgi:hypothetical protein
MTAAAEAAIILAEFLNNLVSVSAQLFRQRAQLPSAWLWLCSCRTPSPC